MRICHLAPLGLVCLAVCAAQTNSAEGPGGNWNKASYPIRVPLLEKAPKIDADLRDWKYNSFTDGVWDLLRVRQAPWYDSGRNRLTDHGNEAAPEDDLSARYYLAWDKKYLYLGAEVHDNVNDVSDPAHEGKRWYFKDSICWFIEAPRQAKPQLFGKGDNGFCFVIDPRKPDYGAWWRHGSPTRTYIEEPIPKSAVDYSIRMNPWGHSPGDFILEARVAMAPTLGVSDPKWRAPQIGDEYGMDIIHCDPDGGGYGGHLMIYGTGDRSESWGTMKLTGPLAAVERKKE